MLMIAALSELFIILICITILIHIVCIIKCFRMFARVILDTTPHHNLLF